MREIKFNAWVPSRNEMRTNISCVRGKAYVYNDVTLQALPLRGAILLEWTGLTDHNDQDIYEGDIIEYSVFTPDEFRQKSVVEFRHGMFTCIGMSEIKKRKATVVGNIYANPKLL